MRLILLTLTLLVGCGKSDGGTVPGTGTTQPTGAGTGTGAASGTGTGTGVGTGTGAGTGTGTGATTPVPFSFSSPDLISSAGDPLSAQCDWVLPAAFSCRGPNPEIAWEGLPAGTTHLVLIFDDPDANDYPHWGIYDIPAAETGLAQGISGDAGTLPPPAGSGELDNGFGFNGYLGSCPGNAHIYRWRLYAMDAVVPAVPGGDAWNQFDVLGTWAEANKIDSLEMCHIYRP